MSAMGHDGKPKRNRPWRCTICGDRFARQQVYGSTGHDTVFDPREGEVAR